MSVSSLDTQLDLLESHFGELSASMLGGSPESLTSDCASLQRLAVELFQLANGLGRGQPQSSRRIQRIKVLSSGVANLRENLLRQMAYVDRALEIVVPASHDKATYAGGGAYGQPVRQSGAFSVLAA